MSIVKSQLADKLEAFLRDRYKKPDIEAVIRFTRQVIKHRPELNCERRGDLNLWNYLPKNKSLFYTEEDRGLAIGNLTS